MTTEFAKGGDRRDANEKVDEHDDGRFMYAPDALARLAIMAASGTLDLSAVDVKSFPLNQLPAALTHAAAMRGLEAAVLTM